MQAKMANLLKMGGVGKFRLSHVSVVKSAEGGKGVGWMENSGRKIEQEVKTMMTSKNKGRIKAKKCRQIKKLQEYKGTLKIFEGSDRGGVGIESLVGQSEQEGKILMSSWLNCSCDIINKGKINIFEYLYF